MPDEILASIEDINANLPSQDDVPVVEAKSENTVLIQVSVARVIRGYLSGAVDSTTLMSWDEPANTPDIIREAAAKMIAAQLYFNFAARTSLTIEDDSFSQKRYDEAMAILNGILAGDILLGPEVPVETTSLDELDFHPVDDTDRAFTMSMKL
jgi:hypothetical protein